MRSTVQTGIIRTLRTNGNNLITFQISVRGIITLELGGYSHEDREITSSKTRNFEPRRDHLRKVVVQAQRVSIRLKRGQEGAMVIMFIIP